jgi:uncharacterized protein (UPF0332 family)
MAFADDLLRDAHHLAGRGGKNPRQSSLRRAVSTAYYALFHLLIADFVLNWRIKDQRSRLGRMFEHRKMLNAKFQGGQGGVIEADLKRVVEAFGLLQDERHSADYDVDLIWVRSEVENTLETADEAFAAWKRIRKQKIAQDHLLTMFGARRA